MYLWRKLTEKQRRELLAFRRLNALPWHSPPHRVCQNGRYLLTAACYEHRHIIGQMPERLADFSERFLKTLLWKAYPIRDYGKNWDPPEL